MSSFSLIARILTARSFMRTRALARRLKSRDDIERWQSHRLAHFLKAVAPRVHAFSSLRGQPLGAFPTMDKAALMGHFDDYNRHRITSDTAWAAFESGTPVHGCEVGTSTGTSGNRGLYLVSNRERYDWLGVILAKALPDIRTAAHRVAIILPANSRLYDAANESGRLALKFFDLTDGIDRQIPRVAAFQPTAIVAPPKVLRAIAEADIDLAPIHVFSGAEVLDPIDRTVIEARFTVPVREIYMATEGLFAVACSHGTMHLAEDAVAFEWEPGPAGGPLKAPLITDFTRRTQMMVRYRMNDLLRLSNTPCPCGSPLQSVSEIVGRMDDVLSFPGTDHKTIRITPDIIRNAILDADRSIDDFRLVQTEPGTVALTLPPGPQDRLDAAQKALSDLFHHLGTDPAIIAANGALKPPEDHKLRRVMRAPDLYSTSDFD